jgi:hypothetical protein
MDPWGRAKTAICWLPSSGLSTIAWGASNYQCFLSSIGLMSLRADANPVSLVLYVTMATNVPIGKTVRRPIMWVVGETSKRVRCNDTPCVCVILDGPVRHVSPSSSFGGLVG